MPNITGNITKTVYKGMLVAREGEVTTTGALGITAASGTGVNMTGSYRDIIDGLTFDASASNSIYGNSTTVQPPALAIDFFIKY